MMDPCSIFCKMRMHLCTGNLRKSNNFVQIFGSTYILCILHISYVFYVPFPSQHFVFSDWLYLRVSAHLRCLWTVTIVLLSSNKGGLRKYCMAMKLCPSSKYTRYIKNSSWTSSMILIVQKVCPFLYNEYKMRIEQDFFDIKEIHVCLEYCTEIKLQASGKQIHGFQTFLQAFNRSIT